MFDIFSPHDSCLVEHNGSLYALAALRDQDLYCLVVFATDLNIRTYTFPFRLDNCGKVVDTLSIMESEEGLPLLRVAGHNAASYNVSLSKILALACC
jgi:hypothetical protein